MRGETFLIASTHFIYGAAAGILVSRRSYLGLIIITPLLGLASVHLSHRYSIRFRSTDFGTNFVSLSSPMVYKK